jgi:hypothetical protein
MWGRRSRFWAVDFNSDRIDMIFRISDDDFKKPEKPVHNCPKLKK